MKEQTARESSIVKTIKDHLNKLPGCLIKKHHGSMFGAAEVDLYGSYKGRAVFLEVKRPGQRPTPRQAKMIRDWEATGAISGCVTSAEEALSLVQSYSN